MADGHFESHDDLEKLWFEAISLVSDRKRSITVKGFIRCTKKKEKRIYEETMVMNSAIIHFPKSSLLVGSELKGVLTILSLGKGRPRMLPYGTQCCELLADEVIGYLTNKPIYLEKKSNSIENAIKDQVIQEKRKADADMMSGEKYKEIEKDGDISRNQHRRKKNKTRVIAKSEPLFTSKRKIWRREDFLKDNEKTTKNETSIERYLYCSVEASCKKRDPLLFFENAYFFNKGTQYIRMILISAWDRHLRWCKDNLYEVPLSHNCILQWKDGILSTTIRNGRPRIVVDVLIVGDIDLQRIKSVSWFTTKMGLRASREPVIGVLQP